jgi:protoporphyrinogen oxidase
VKSKDISSVVIVGAGASGLAAAREFQKRGVQVTLVEKAEKVGGLAGSLEVQGTPLELFYHHLFGSDTTAIKLIKELGLGDKLVFYPASNAIYYKEHTYPFSSATDMLLRFSPLDLVSRLRFAFSSAYLKLTNDWMALEKELALPWMRKWAGSKATDVIWEPLLQGKFGNRAADIPMSWLWARIHYRTFRLGYMTGGFHQVYDALAKAITQAGGTLITGQGVEVLSSTSKGVSLVLEDGRKLKADLALVTVSDPLFAKMTKAPLALSDPKNHLGATCFVLELDHSFIPQYWLNINDSSFPFLAVVEHTRLMGTKAYGGKHIVYVGNYVPHDDWRYITDPEKLLKQYIPYLQKLNPEFKKSWIKKWHFSKAPFAQPIITRNYSTQLRPHKTDFEHIWLANMAQVYPQDRGQNYAFAMAEKVVKEMLGED